MLSNWSNFTWDFFFFAESLAGALDLVIWVMVVGQMTSLTPLTPPPPLAHNPPPLSRDHILMFKIKINLSLYLGILNLNLEFVQDRNECSEGKLSIKSYQSYAASCREVFSYSISNAYGLDRSISKSCHRQLAGLLLYMILLAGINVSTISILS